MSDRPVRRVAVLGSTGSIGRQALSIVEQSLDDDVGAPHRLHVAALAARTDWQLVASQAECFAYDNARPLTFLSDPAAAGELARAHPDAPTLRTIGELLDASKPDIVLNAIVGFAGLEATLAALERGIDVALANKESLVAAGALCREVARANSATIVPVDSEHSALQQCLGESSPAAVEALVLTASGGPFFGQNLNDLADVTPERALDHPTWKMGGKITIDSATLMNKGLELIEAMVLFELPADRIEVVVHRHSIVHALVRHRDGSLMAHLGWPDMRVPIAWALHHPQRTPIPDARRLDLVEMPSLAFAHPDVATFRCLALAREAAVAGGGAPCVLNAANEVAVEAFLSGTIGFCDIANVVESTLGAVNSTPAPGSLDAAAEIDHRARLAAAEFVA